jgi:hypothetical protein
VLDQGSVASLGEPNRIIGTLALGDVERKALPQRCHALRRIHVRGHVLEPQDAAVPRPYPVHLAERGALRIGLALLGDDSRAVVLVE